MYGQVRVPPNWRREVRVTTCGQAKVAEVLGRVACFLHRPQHQKGNRLFFGRVLNTIEQPLKMTRTNRVERGGKTEAEARDKLLELFDLEKIRLLMDAIDCRCLALLQVLGHGLVREQHELFNQSMSNVAFGGDNRLDQPGLIRELLLTRSNRNQSIHASGADR